MDIRAAGGTSLTQSGYTFTTNGNNVSAESYAGLVWAPFANTKWYFEFLINAVGTSTTEFYVGIGAFFDSSINATASVMYRQNGATNNVNTSVGGHSTYTTGDVIGMAVDLLTKKAWFAKNNTWVGDPVAQTGGMGTITTPSGLRPRMFIGATGGATGRQATIRAKAASLGYSPPSGYAAVDDGSYSESGGLQMGFGNKAAIALPTSTGTANGFGKANPPFGGFGIIQGVVKISDGNVLVSRRVRLYDKETGRLVAETWSNTSGVYQFRSVSPYRTFEIYAFDYTKSYLQARQDYILISANA